MTRTLLVAVLLVCTATALRAGEIIPPKPAGYFNDYAGVVSKEAASRFNEKLAQFERETSNQVWVVVYPKMQSDSDIADYTYRVKEAWHVGQKGRDNGAVLFVFADDRKMRIETGYGVEGGLPDVTAFDIIERHIKPKFKASDYEGGLTEGIDLICKAIRGEYKGDGKTDLERASSGKGGGGQVLFIVIFLIIVLMAMRSSRRRRGYGYSSFGGPFIGGWGGGSGGGWSSGSSSDGGFSGSLGGGGTGGGGGASGSW